MRILGIDYGRKRSGIAVSDPGFIIAQPSGYIYSRPEETFLMEIEKVCGEHEIGIIVLGLPLRTGGEEGPEAGNVRALGSKIETRTGIPVSYWDERFTTSTAERVLIEGNVSRAGRKEKIDSVAAAVMLQHYLDSHEPAG